MIRHQLLCLVCLMALVAASSAGAAEPVADGLPPPDLGEPRAKAAARSATNEPLPEKIVDDDPANIPAVSIRREDDGAIVEEYREGGRLTMVVVHPAGGGLTYRFLDTNNDGRLDEKDSDGAVNPVYYTLYEWN